MTKKWYAVYTKPRCEKKITALLAKKKIESYCPLIGAVEQKKIAYRPLFSSYVFVHAYETQLKAINLSKGIISFLYWMDKPVVIKNEEIEAIKQFVHDHENIQLEKMEKKLNDLKPATSKSLVTIEERMIPVKNKTMKILHTSLGFSIIAEVDEATAEIIYEENKEKSTFLKHYKKANGPAHS
jgi:transcription antitermination factor NusG